MSSYIGIINKSKAKVEHRLIKDSLQELAYWAPDNSEVLFLDNIGFGQNTLFTSPESLRETLPGYYESSKCSIVADARIDYREELSNKLGIDWDASKNYSDSRLIIEAYWKWGRNCINYIFGDFSFAIWDGRIDELFCARDHMGCKPFVYFDTKDFLAFSSELRGLSKLQDIKLKIEDYYVVDCMISVVASKSQTGFCGIKQLEPSHTLTLAKSKISIKKYWDLSECKKVEIISEKDAIKKLNELLLNAVKQRLRSAFPVGVELSGGLDSSGIASIADLLYDNCENNLYALTHALPNSINKPLFPFYDETSYSNLIVNNSKSIEHYVISGEKLSGSLFAITDFLEVNKSPISQTFAVMSDLLYDKAKTLGIRVLLSGFGGDEGVSSNHRNYLDELQQRENRNSLFSEIRYRLSSEGGRYFLTLFKFLIYHKIPFFLKMLKLFRREDDYLQSRYNAFCIDGNLGNKLDAKSRFLNHVSIASKFDSKQEQFNKILHPYVQDRLTNSYLNAQKRKIEYRYPLLDVKLLEFYFSLPSSYHFRSGYGRYIFRKAIEGLVPHDICWRNDKMGSTIPNIQYRFLKDEKYYRKLIVDSRKNNSFHYVDYSKAEWMITQLKSRDNGEKITFAPRAFFSAMSVLILQKWQREGKIDIGIKC